MGDAPVKPEKAFYRSKKFWAAVLTALGAIGAGLSGAQEWATVATEIIGIGGLFMASTGLADFGKNK